MTALLVSGINTKLANLSAKIIKSFIPLTMKMKGKSAPMKQDMMGRTYIYFISKYTNIVVLVLRKESCLVFNLPKYSDVYLAKYALNQDERKLDDPYFLSFKQ